MEQAGTRLEHLLISALRRTPGNEAPLLAWPLVCGSVVSERTRVLDFTANVLRVEVPNVAWKHEMQHLASHYLASLNRFAGQKVERIEFVIRPDGIRSVQPALVNPHK